MLNYAELAEFNYVELIYYKVGQVLRSGEIYCKAEHYKALYFKKWLFMFYIYIHTYIFIYIHVCICIYTYIYLYVHICVCICAMYIYTYIYLYVHICVCICAIDIHIYICMYIYVHIVCEHNDKNNYKNKHMTFIIVCFLLKKR